MKIVLYNPRSNAARKRIVPFSLLAIGAVLEDRFEYEIVDGNVVDDADRALIRKVAAGVSVVGMSVMPGPQLEDAVLRTRALKLAHPSVKVVWGGYFATEHSEACLNSGLVDYVVRGHGESAMVELLADLSSGRDPLEKLSLIHI